MIKQVLFFLVPLALAASVAAQGTAESKRKNASAKTKAWKIQNAMSAAPVALAKDATIVDQPQKEGGDMAVLRKGTNEWTCIPDDPATPSNDPMCLDKNAIEWAKGVDMNSFTAISRSG